MEIKMKRFEVTVAVSENYKVIVDAHDEEDAHDEAYSLTVHEIMEGDFINSDVEVLNVEDISFDKED